MSGAAPLLKPAYVRLSGEVADQVLLDQLHATYPNARIAHAFASTEAGVAFDVNDGRAGFPAEFIDGARNGIEMKVEDGTLRIRSQRTAARYLGAAPAALAGGDGYVDTGDLVELQDGRYYFRGRKGGIINVGGLKGVPGRGRMRAERRSPGAHVAGAVAAQSDHGRGGRGGRGAQGAG